MRAKTTKSTHGWESLLYRGTATALKGSVIMSPSLHKFKILLIQIRSFRNLLSRCKQICVPECRAECVPGTECVCMESELPRLPRPQEADFNFWHRGRFGSDFNYFPFFPKQMRRKKVAPILAQCGNMLLVLPINGCLLMNTIKMSLQTVF